MLSNLAIAGHSKAINSNEWDCRKFFSLGWLLVGNLDRPVTVMIYFKFLIRSAVLASSLFHAVLKEYHDKYRSNFVFEKWVLYTLGGVGKVFNIFWY